MIEGGFTEAYGRRHRTCGPGSVLFRPADEDHADVFTAGARCLNVELSPSWIARLTEYAPGTSSSVDITKTTVGALATRLYREFLVGDDLSALAIEGLAMEMLAGLSRVLRAPASERDPPRWLGRARELLVETAGARVSLPDLAEQVGVHPVHLARSFRRHYGSTVGEYVRRRRVDEACRLMDTTPLPLSRIALDVGFSHQSHFTNAFKRVTGMTPSGYRLRRAGYPARSSSKHRAETIGWPPVES